MVCPIFLFAAYLEQIRFPLLYYTEFLLGHFLYLGLSNVVDSSAEI